MIEYAPLLCAIGLGAVLGAGLTLLAGFVRRVLRWRKLATPPPVPTRVPFYWTGVMTVRNRKLQGMRIQE